MKLTFSIIAIMAICLHDLLVMGDNHALYYKNDLEKATGDRVQRQTNADQMVQNILQWIQGVYTQNSRKIRQGTLREYLPPSNTQRPRPFQPIGSPNQPQYQSGYPPAGITPQPPFPIYTNPTTGAVTSEGGYSSPPNEINPPYPGQSTAQPPYLDNSTPQGFSTEFPPSQTTNYPSSSRPGFPTRPPTSYTTTNYQSSQQPGYTTQTSVGYTTDNPSSLKPGFPSYTFPPSNFPTRGSTQVPTSTLQSTTITSPPPITFEPVVTKSENEAPITSGPSITTSSYYTSAVNEFTTPDNSNSGSVEDNNIVPGGKQITNDNSVGTVTLPSIGDDLNHPPHIHAVDVECAKDMMTISIEFNREFNGIIYSKGHYNTPECRYVNENSEQTKYKFTVNLNSCGTEFINAFDTQNQSYLENILVIQNEVGIQEVWDTVRSVRCLWEGNLKDSLSVALSVGMLNQEIITFSGDTAMAKLDIQMGKGPFAQPTNGLVKIGEPMTLVISVTGDPGFDIQVKDCRATDSSDADHIYPLTDDNGCVLKPKLFGAFQKTRTTGNTGASVIAYAFFNAFKFPDVMDLLIQCNIELCKTDCQVCSDPNQKIDPSRRRRKRDLAYYNQTDGMAIGKNLRVVLPADLTDIEAEVLHFSHANEVCLSVQNFVLSSVLIALILIISCLVSVTFWVKNQRIFHKL